MKLRKRTIFQIIGCIIGLSLLLYPTVSNYWNSKHATKAINNYLEKLDDLDDEEYRQMLVDADEYNKTLLKRASAFSLDSEQREKYNKLLNVSGDGIIGYVEIDKIEVSLPIYHGTANNVLQRATGHINWSSLPVGGESTHAAISGHRGLPNMRLFTDLDKLREGDIFTINVLKETFTYEVDQIRIVLPEEVDDLKIVEGKDYVTLITCTPYGINTHRMLVRGHRIDNIVAEARVVAEAVKVDQLIVAMILAIPILLVLILVVLFKKPSKKRNLTVKEILEEAQNETND